MAQAFIAAPSPPSGAASIALRPVLTANTKLSGSVARQLAKLAADYGR